MTTRTTIQKPLAKYAPQLNHAVAALDLQVLEVIVLPDEMRKLSPEKQYDAEQVFGRLQALGHLDGVRLERFLHASHLLGYPVSRCRRFIAGRRET